MLKGTRLHNSDEAEFGGSDWVKCSSIVILTTSAIVTCCLVFILLIFQIRVYGFTYQLLRKTKAIVVLLTLAFNICLIIDLLRYPLVSYVGTTIINVLEFSFKYSAIIGISHFFISRSGDLVTKNEKKRF